MCSLESLQRRKAPGRQNNHENHGSAPDDHSPVHAQEILLDGNVSHAGQRSQCGNVIRHDNCDDPRAFSSRRRWRPTTNAPTSRQLVMIPHDAAAHAKADPATNRQETPQQRRSGLCYPGSGSCLTPNGTFAELCFGDSLAQKYGRSLSLSQVP